MGVAENIVEEQESRNERTLKEMSKAKTSFGRKKNYKY